MARSRVVLALDTASTTGWGLFHGSRRHASGVIVLKQRTINKVKEQRGAKYSKLVQYLDESIEGDGPIPFVRKPDVLVLETGGFFRSRDAAEVSHGIMAAAELWAYQNGVLVARILNWNVKDHATGNRNASKDDMVKAARKIWRGVRLTDDNEADALHLGRAYVDGVEHK